MPGSWPLVFQNLTDDVHIVKSPYDRNYNCIAFAADDQEKWWWPASPDDYWPPTVTNRVTMDAFIEAFGTMGYAECPDGNLEDGFEKVALYGQDSAAGLVPTHMAKQLPDGRWKSKLGRHEDIEHVNLANVDCTNYGSARRYLKRPIKGDAEVENKTKEAAEEGASDAEATSPPTGVENPNGLEDFTSLLNVAAQKPKQGD